jgi:SpoIIAA-like
MLRSSPMLLPIADLPEGVLGFEATGKIDASDFRDVMMPAVRAVWERGEEVRIVLVFERWEGMSSGAAWEDLKVGMKNLTKWKRIALVTDLDWMITVVSLFGWMTPGELKRFPVAEREGAIAWVAQRDDAT